MQRPTSPLFLRLAALALCAALGAVAPAASADTASPKVVKKVPPDFPGEAVRKGITDGVLKARLSIDGQGAVTEVAIVEATPAKAKVFTEAATQALNQWRFEPSGKPQTFELKLVFQQE
ncbi:MAG TPA: energy transducer TonB [Burkholderiaceae bacterium]|jgi:TonB family protein|nr:energy transducer TonB [Burkholderiaceae bacterium]